MLSIIRSAVGYYRARSRFRNHPLKTVKIEKIKVEPKSIFPTLGDDKFNPAFIAYCQVVSPPELAGKTLTVTLWAEGRKPTGLKAQTEVIRSYVDQHSAKNGLFSFSFGSDDDFAICGDVSLECIGKLLQSADDPLNPNGVTWTFDVEDPVDFMSGKIFTVKAISHPSVELTSPIHGPLTVN